MVFKSDALGAARPAGRVAVALLANALGGDAALAEQALRMSYPTDRALSCGQLLAEQKRMDGIIDAAAARPGQEQELRRTAEARRAIVTGLYQGKNCGDGRRPPG